MDTTQTAGSATDPAERENDQPGLGELREVVATHLQTALPSGGTLRRDGIAGLSSAINNVPDGLAGGLLVGVNPASGLYASMVGPIAGGLFSGTSLLIITTTSAAALAAGQALAGLQGEERESALFLLVILVGAFQILFGLLRLGRLVRFVSYSVMTGFLTGIAVLTVLSQLPTVTGYEASGANNVAKAFDLLANLGRIDPPTLAMAILALTLAVLLPRTRPGNVGRLLAIVVPSALVALLGWNGVRIVEDVGGIPRGLPTPFVPSLSAITPEVVTGAPAIAAIILVEGAGVSQSVPNPDGSRASVSRDFVPQGVANVASGLFRGLPVGGSLGSTSLNVLSGARTRWAAILSGVWVAAIVILFPGPMSSVAMPTLGALLIIASAGAVKPKEALSIWRTGWPPRLAIVVTFLATLLLPIQAAVGIGVVLSAALTLLGSAADLSAVVQVKPPDGRIEERELPKELPARRVTVLRVYGSLFYTGARTLERQLPSPRHTRHPVVILWLRGRDAIGATLIDVLATYADKLRGVNGRLYLTEVSEGVYDQIARTRKRGADGGLRAYKATPIVVDSTRRAQADAEAWLADQDRAAGAR